MLRVNIICVGKLKEKYLRDAAAEYAKRLAAYCKFNIIELDEEKTIDVPNRAAIESVLNAEGRRILSKIDRSDLVAAMCIEGRQMSSEKFARYISESAVNGVSTVDFIIGGSWGLSDEVKQRASIRLSMSEMTFPHQLARVMLCEQIYRAFSINAGTKYHK
ncbi:MAG: 23S rRNA (pseudouridine(1915)-N(3))-methyltransferase RlmH [Clostridia bacterium]|nr:23S rRNA (pseudouridine(1915)-N(3))-methyltransferase RlmH [Clostridia bacterium]